MLVIILGGTGFIGRALCAELLGAGHEVAVVSRSPAKVRSVLGEGVRALEGGGPGSWAGLLGPETAVVNLAGENIAARWTPERMRRILESRVRSGEAVAAAVAEAKERRATAPALVVQGSAVGFYGPQPGDLVLDEESPSGGGFLAEVCRKWEAASRPVEELGVPRAVVRTGVVLGPGGALAKMVPPFRFFLGGPVGSGRQVLSWIHLADEVGAIRYLIENRLGGVFNLTSPQPATSREFARALGRALRRPALLPVPGFALRLLYGRMADEALLSGQRALPSALLRAGYEFRRPQLDAALADAVQGL
ncbi:TIGR01777 family oxidoreductase [Paucidesulfovibrio longus]|uniref:TIGR01777 family oxidoreductase n=1 Tax=Paucidesulfovibrio longus TaxID=889 RepID=UPI0003B5E66E|nr:TIGR01777 family oxidoreductase [Paucidesulfovibrio longus]